ncbi:phosphohistidine phosphatase SixA [Vibrio tapetis subsp. quintayensis]|uniref:phosphohistidine phosphatase SixA n=1 Tax=Vibrio tapetis TaxID=52443 RepID=UPI0025B29D76|nr:phosphohistidine phosphatase SixA [Vibrio tapetis]MDN3680577.1 phosphohistidine phosphatase SixA [Vibrio tapetis subsp. quintayensis]
MKVFIMRHGEAEMFASRDSERELTQRGIDQSLLVAKACSKQGHQTFDLVLVSPYIRAQQTWKTISQVFSAKDGRVETCDDITPYGDSEDVYDYVCALAETQSLESILLVSHLPLVGYLTSEFVTDMPPPMFPTSGLVCANFDAQSGKGEFAWHIHP